MRSRSALLLIIIVVFSIVVNAEEPNDPSDIIKLTQQDFDDQTATGDWLLEFFAPWCGHCKKLYPIYNELATKLKGKVNVASIDCTVEKGLCKRFGVRGYPTVKFLKDKMVYEYKGDRSKQSFEEFVAVSYRSEAPSPIPPRPGTKQIIAEYITTYGGRAAIFFKDHPATVIAVGLFLGVGLAILISIRAEQNAARQPPMVTPMVPNLQAQQPTPIPNLRPQPQQTVPQPIRIANTHDRKNKNE